jgi:hypothetical protein
VELVIIGGLYFAICLIIILDCEYVDNKITLGGN